MAQSKCMQSIHDNLISRYPLRNLKTCFSATWRNPVAWYSSTWIIVLRRRQNVRRMSKTSTLPSNMWWASHKWFMFDFLDRRHVSLYLLFHIKFWSFYVTKFSVDPQLLSLPSSSKINLFVDRSTTLKLLVWILPGWDYHNHRGHSNYHTKTNI